MEAWHATQDHAGQQGDCRSGRAPSLGQQAATNIESLLNRVISGPSQSSKKKGASAPFSDLPAAPAVVPAAVPPPMAEEPRSTVEAVGTIIVGSPPAPAPGITYPAHLNSGVGEAVDMGQSIRHR